MEGTYCSLSQNAEAIKELIRNSKEFLKVVTFRFDNKEFADLILERAKNNIDIEIITTPPDNVAKDVLRPIVEEMYEELRANNVRLHLCRWEAGEPRLTTTSMSGNQSAGIGEKWYSLHLQLLINENEALVTSRPLTSDNTIDIFYKSTETSFLTNALQKFEAIKEKFLTEKTIDGLQFEGNVIETIDQKTLQETINFYKQSQRLNIKHYDISKLPKNPPLTKGLFLSPFEGKMRDLLYSFIDEAKDYLYFFLETFFDEELIGKLQEKIISQPGIQIKVLTCPPERIRQSPHKAREIVTQALSSGIQIGNLVNIQAKFWVSDKWLAISSGDFNRMNLGHNTSANRWKTDTQLLALENNQNLIDEMKLSFEEKFTLIDQGKICMKDLKVLVIRMAKQSNLSASTAACTYISRFKAQRMIKTEQDVKYIMESAIKLAKLDGKIRLEGSYILMAIIIYHIQRREHRLDEIVERLEIIEKESEIRQTVNRMEQKGQLVKINDVYRIAPNLGNLKSISQTNIQDY